MVTKAKTTKKKPKEKVVEEKEEFDWEAENKKEEFEKKVKKLIKIVVGLLFCIGGIWLIAIFWSDFLTIFKQWVGPGVILIGLFIILLGTLD